jgi:hypothetical protein
MWNALKTLLMAFIDRILLPLLFKAIEDWITAFVKWADERSKRRREEAEWRAAEAARAAAAAATQADRDRYAAVAQVWREVAEQFRLENEELKMKLQETVDVALKKVPEAIRASPPELVIVKGHPKLLLGDRSIEVPESLKVKPPDPWLEA